MLDPNAYTTDTKVGRQDLAAQYSQLNTSSDRCSNQSTVEGMFGAIYLHAIQGNRNDPHLLPLPV